MSFWVHASEMRARSAVVVLVSTVVVGALMVMGAPPAAAQTPPWPPPAPTPPFPPLQPTPGQLPGTAAAPAAPPAASPAAPASGPVSGVKALQQRLKELAYDPGPIDGKAGSMTRFAVIAFQKVQGLKVTGVADAATYAALTAPKGPPVLGGSGDRIEIDLGRQLLTAYRGGRLTLISHISSGSGKSYCEAGHCGTAITPRGNFTILWSRSGWERAPLGLLYNPQYFTTAGHAIHGSPSVPLYPASHGCVRIPMHTAQWFPSIVSKGEAVIVA
jgi:lipoprotein-anchoring transpeptidase ErfK/SrfK